MQLLILLMLALAGGNCGALNEVKPVLESLGGADALKALDKAQELSGVINALQTMAGSRAGGAPRGKSGSESNCGQESGGEFAQHGFPLAPIADIADENIMICLSRYIAAGG